MKLFVTQQQLAKIKADAYHEGTVNGKAYAEKRVREECNREIQYWYEKASRFATPRYEEAIMDLARVGALLESQWTVSREDFGDGAWPVVGRKEDDK